MAQNSLANLNVRLGFVFDQKSLTRVERQLRTTGDRLARTGSNISLFISAPLALLGSGAIKAAGEFESLRLAMEATFKNAGRTVEEARAEVEALRKAALAPGLDFPQAVAASIRLQSVGINAETARTTIQELANAIASTGGTAQNLESVTVQMAQMISKGKVLSQDLRIIQENLPIISDLMLKAFGTANAEKIQELGITGKDFVKGITAEMTKLTRVQGGISNALVNAGSAIKQALAGVGDEIARVLNIGALSDKFASALHSIVEGFKGLSDGTKTTIVQVALFLAALGPVTVAMGAINSVGAALIGMWKNMIGVLVFVVEGIGSVITAINAMSLAARAFSLIGIVGIVLGIAYALGAFTKEATAAEQAQSALNNVQKDAEGAIVSEKAAIVPLISVLNDETATRDAKEAALKRLIDISPKYFGQLKIENGVVVGLTASYDAYIANLLLAAKARIAEGKLVENDQKRTEELKKQKDLQDQLAKSAADIHAQTTSGTRFNPNEVGGAVVSGQAGRAGAIAEELKASQKLVEALNLEDAELTKLSRANFDAAATTTKLTETKVKQGLTDKELSAAAKERKKELKDEKDALNDLIDKIKEEDAARAASLGAVDTSAAPSSGGQALAGGGFSEIVQAQPLSLGQDLSAPTGFSQALKEQQDILVALADQFRKTDVEAGIFGTTQDTLKTKLAETQSAITAAIDAGYSPASDIVTALTDKYNALSVAIEASNQKMDRMAAIGDGITAIADTIGAALSDTGSSFKSFAKAAIGAITDVIGKLIQLAVAQVIAGSIKLASFLGPLAAPVAIAAGTIAAAAIKGLIGRIGGFAKGTRDAPGGLSLVGEKGAELINLPRHSQVFPAHQTSSMLKDVGGAAMSLSGEFSVRGSDLVLVLDRVQQKQARQR